MRFTLNLLKLWRGLFILDLVSQRLQRESKVTRIQLAKGNVDRPRIGSALSARPRGCWFAHEVPNTANFSVPLKTGIDASRVTSHQNLVSAPFYPPMGNSIFISKLCEQSSKPAPKLKGRAPCPTLE
ncbi:uncharacterized protein DFL_008444 [Arthrobotrys flagrans]|uniref:Uncharacterized protein n=1 Tax=Arthrobotrys flagrans TaxID=97331 RepID=A0A436ZNS0_ARTFL|nr:hypothetical protein DFL_008444 [Arthrobotrys flagrans]